ncbi:MAG: hypothetical protein CL678_06285 [Bdellovibrionaceae bacterium]|nr:hypothetical protein [Pseudobdellovibrionaceae bacterium]
MSEPTLMSQMFDIEGAQERMRSNVSRAVMNNLNVQGMHRTLEVERVEFSGAKPASDYSHQRKLKDNKGTYSELVKATVKLKDNNTGKVISKAKVNVGHLPVLTPRLSYLVNGREYQVQSQFRRKSGVYTRIADNGAFQAIASSAHQGQLKMDLNPSTKMISIQPIRGSQSNLSMYALLKGAGRTDEEISKAWGPELVSANRAKYNSDLKIRKELIRVAKKVAEPGDLFTTSFQASRVIFKHLKKFTLDPRVTQDVLGKPHAEFNQEAMMDTGRVLVGVVKGEVKPTSYDNIGHKKLMGAEDLIEDFINRKKSVVKRRVKNKVDRETDVRNVIRPNMLDREFLGFFKNGGETQLSSEGNQTNPLAMIDGHMKTTVKGMGGISTGPGMQLGSAQGVHSSHVNFLDPIDTGEKMEAGLILQLSMNSSKRGTDITSRVYDVKAKKFTFIDAITADRSNLAYPDEYRYNKKTNTYTPLKSKVKVVDKDGKFTQVSPSKVDYIIPTAQGQFGVGVNMIPFLNNNNGNRVMMGAKQATQAMSLVNREAPLVQVSTPGGNSTLEKAVGSWKTIKAPVEGTISSITKDTITLKGVDKKTHKISMYDDFPTNDKRGFLQHEPVVKVGDKVKKGQLLADMNYTKDGTLALGTNLRVGYLPMKGYNFEDGVVISRSASEKLASEHLYKYDLQATIKIGLKIKPSEMSKLEDGAVVISKTQYLAWAPSSARMSGKSMSKLGDNGVIKKGSRVEKGDILIAAVRKSRTDSALSSIKKSTRFNAAFRPYEVKWTKDFIGTVSRVVDSGTTVTVYVKSSEPMVIGDKVAGRYGNKGIVTKILEDHEMPYYENKKGEKQHIQIALHPAGVPGRINPGQLLETAAGKIAEKTGKPYVVKPFDGENKDVTRNLIKELKSHGLSDQEMVKDPETGKDIGSVLAGKQFIQKLVHVADKKLTARGGAALPGMDSYQYDLNKQPVQGYPSGGQAMGALGIYALLGHNARANLKELQTHRSTYERAEKPGEYDSDDYWLALMNGTPLPAAQPTFAVKKFESYLQGLGVNIKKNADELQLVPMTDADVLKQCSYEVKNPNRAIEGKTAKPEKGGLFDFPDGQMDSKKWGHVKLGGRVVNPVFQKPASVLLGIPPSKFDAVVRGTQEINGFGSMDDIVKGLGKLNIDTELQSALKRSKETKGSERDKCYKRIKLLNNLKKLNLSPKEAYSMSVMPVLPPAMRPVALSSVSGSVGDIETVDINQLYRQVGQAAYQLRTLPKETTDEYRRDVEYELYKSLRSAYVEGAMNNRGAPMSSLLQFITKPKGTGGKEKQGKAGYFQNKLIKRRYDLTGRSVITPEPKLKLDQVGILRKMAMQVYRPFIVRELKASGYSPREAIKKLREEPKSVPVLNALDRAIKSRPALIKRDPALHKFNVLAFDPVITEGKSVQIHPMVVGGFNADFDGDTMAVFVPSGEEARIEAENLKPSKNLFSTKSFNITNTPSWGMAYGIYQLSEIKKTSNKKFSTPVQAYKAFKDGKLGQSEGFKLNGKITTVGRLKLHDKLPSKIKNSELGKSVLFGEELSLKKVKGFLNEVARSSPEEFPNILDEWKDLGNNSSYNQVWSFSLEDYKAHKDIRDKYLKKADEKIAKLKNPSDDVKIKVYGEASAKIRKELAKRLDKGDNKLWRMTRKSGAMGSKYNQVEQMIASPLQVVDLEGKTVVDPVRMSYSEGMSSGDYWTTMPGVRAGTLARAKGTADPGARAKGLINLAINLPVMEDDCGTSSGVSINVSDKDIESRHIAETIKVKGKTITRNTVIDTQLATLIRSSNLKAIKVRSTLTCALNEGVCKKCSGLRADGKAQEIGENVGITAAQSVSEPLTQMSMNAFHTGGSASGAGADSVGELKAVAQLLEMPKTLKDKAIISPVEGKVRQITEDKSVGGFIIKINEVDVRIPAQKNLLVKVGDRVRAAQKLCNGPVSPHDVLEYTDMGTTRAFMVDALYKVYGSHGIRRRHVETVVKNLTNVVEVVTDKETEFTPGEVVYRTRIGNINSERKKLGLETIKVKPILKGIDETVRIKNDEDFIAGLNYQHIKDVILEGAAHGAKSKLHGVNPIPGIVYGHEFGKGKKAGEY